jgi:hypothetical protein
VAEEDKRRKGEGPISYYKSFVVVKLEDEEEQEPQSPAAEVKEEELQAPAVVPKEEAADWGLPSSPAEEEPQAPPPPPLALPQQTGIWFVDKCGMPLHLALRFKKLMRDVGNLAPEELFQSVRFY